jgi:hypothetical protein
MQLWFPPTMSYPTARWQWPPYLVSVAIWLAWVAVLGLLSVPYLAMYPEHGPHRYDHGSERQREVIRRYRQRLSRTPTYVRVWRGTAAVGTLPFYMLRALFIPGRCDA